MSSSPEKTATTPESISIPSLPDDLFLSCIARLSKLYYPTLSLVSKRFPPLLTSPELHKSRSLLNRNESCLYLCLGILNDPILRWFTLCRKPNNRNLFIPISTLRSPPPRSQWFDFAAVGSTIYNIGCDTCVSILDCRSHTWVKAPSRSVKTLNLSACVVDDKIYVTGDKDYGRLKSIEVFDTKTGIWDLVPCPKDVFECKSASMEGKLHILNKWDEEQGLVYDPKEGKWNLVKREMDFKIWFSDPYCVIENVLYCYNYRGCELIWYDAKSRYWKSLKGLVGLPKFPEYDFRRKLVDYGGKMAVLWVEDLSIDDGDYKTMIWCAEIVLEKCGDEIWGEVEWIDNVLTVSGGFCDLLKVLAVTL